MCDKNEVKENNGNAKKIIIMTFLACIASILFLIKYDSRQKMEQQNHEFVKEYREMASNLHDEEMKYKKLSREITSSSLKWLEKSGADPEKGNVILRYNECMSYSQKGVGFSGADCLKIIGNKEFSEVVHQAIKNSSVSDEIKNKYLGK